MSDYPLEWGWHTDPKDGAPAMTPVRPTLLGGDPADILAAYEGPAATQMPTPVKRTLKKRGDTYLDTYLDSRFAPRIDAFIKYASDRGIDPEFISAYRSQPHQDYIRAHPRESGAIYPPAKHSLHSAGLAVDVQYEGQDPQTQRILLEAARNAGLNWGGAYGDVNHFDYNLGGSIESHIRNFATSLRDKHYFDIEWWNP